ncbi:hypothetical protein FHR99_003222 [Litorivivens lipolytica]|uniref:Uncharacterized protein n=1 Tax=Litorivivens lipolytica TaxID=1524264 RepID=A0A7W4Z762_9GAMM|nr:hypothetical protein [Litorivivens lipolytica]MBB3048948.1 hypothetical protein [Litorivivens lipolytica]
MNVFIFLEKASALKPVSPQDIAGYKASYMKAERRDALQVSGSIAAIMLLLGIGAMFSPAPGLAILALIAAVLCIGFFWNEHSTSSSVFEVAVSRMTESDFSMEFLTLCQNYPEILQTIQALKAKQEGTVYNFQVWQLSRRGHKLAVEEIQARQMEAGHHAA